MLWIILALLTAFSDSLKTVFSRLGLKKSDHLLISWALSLFALPFIIPFIITLGIPEIKSMFWIALLVSGTLNLIATILYILAIKHSDLSVIMPMLAFTPVFLLITSPLTLGEYPSPFGVLGVLLIVIGSYVLKIKNKKKGLFSPFKALLEEKGAKYMLLVAFIWSITSNFDKIGVLNSSSFFWVFSVLLYMSIFMIPIIWFKSRKNLFKLLKQWKQLLPIGFFNALVLIFQMHAIKYALVPYVISVKRSSAVMNVFWGHFFFKEKGFKERLTGSILMLTGVIIITLTSI